MTQLWNNLRSDATPPLGLASLSSAAANQVAEMLNLQNVTQSQLAQIEFALVGTIAIGVISFFFFFRVI